MNLTHVTVVVDTDGVIVTTEQSAVETDIIVVDDRSAGRVIVDAGKVIVIGVQVFVIVEAGSRVVITCFIIKSLNVSQVSNT